MALVENGNCLIGCIFVFVISRRGVCVFVGGGGGGEGVVDGVWRISASYKCVHKSH